MKFVLSAVLCMLCALCAFAADSQKQQIIVSYPKDTPEAVLDSAKEAVIQAGGFITHEYSLIRGFAANVAAKVVDTIEAAGAEHNVLVEMDQTVSVA